MKITFPRSGGKKRKIWKIWKKKNQLRTKKIRLQNWYRNWTLVLTPNIDNKFLSHTTLSYNLTKKLNVLSYSNSSQSGPFFVPPSPFLVVGPPCMGHNLRMFEGQLYIVQVKGQLISKDFFSRLQMLQKNNDFLYRFQL